MENSENKMSLGLGPCLNMMSAAIELARTDIKKNNRYAEEAEWFLGSDWCKAWVNLAEDLAQPQAQIGDTPRQGKS